MLALLADQQRTARDLLPSAVHDYYATGSGDEITLDEAARAWSRYRFHPHVLRDVSTVDTSTSLFGTSLRTPVLAAPTAYHGLAHPDGECATATGIGAAGSLLVLSSRCSRRIEDVGAAATGPWWFQVYMLGDPELSRQMTRRAVAAGAAAMVLTADTPYTGVKKRTAMPPVDDKMYLVNMAAHLAPDAVVDTATAQHPGATFDTVRELTELGVPVLVKGVLRADDAEACLAAGAAGIVVSNHGGRQLDRAVDTASALAEVSARLAGRCPVLVDGGIRSGRDVLTALALGADAVLLGRPVLWALAADGAAGVTSALEAIRTDLMEALALSGLTRLAEISADLVSPRTW